MRAALTVTIAAACLQAGCYNYQPLRRSELAPSTYLTLTLTESGSEELAPYVGPGVLIVRGRFLSTTDRALNIAVSSVETQRGNILQWQGETVAVPPEFVRAVHARHGAVTKTVLLAGASLAGFFAAYAAFGPGAAGTTPSGTGHGPASR